MLKYNYSSLISSLNFKLPVFYYQKGRYLGMILQMKMSFVGIVKCSLTNIVTKYSCMVAVYTIEYTDKIFQIKGRRNCL